MHAGTITHYTAGVTSALRSELETVYNALFLRL